MISKPLPHLRLMPVASGPTAPRFLVGLFALGLALRRLRMGLSVLLCDLQRGL
ncbi:MAG TPA: hypothetical protein VIP31_08040 [Acidovorax sp.]